MNEKRNALDLLNNAISILKGNFSKKDEVKMLTSKVKFKFEIVETAEGATISYPSLEVGAPVTQASNEGESPANDGWYAVEGDIKIKVEGGLIAEIEQPEAETNEEFEEGAEDAPEAVVDNTAVVEAIEQAVEAVQAIQEEIEVLKSEFSQFNKVNADILALTDAVQKFSKEPISTSVTQAEEKFEKTKEDQKMEKIRAIGQRNLKK